MVPPLNRSDVLHVPFEQSFMDCSTDTGKFYGTLDIKTLGGAGFASQRTTGDDREWDLSGYEGVAIDIAAIDDKTYTFILKDELLPRNPDNGREEATLSYEYDFTASTLQRSANGDSLLFIPWNSLKATYRGREKKDGPPLDLKQIRRISIMNRR